VTPIIPSTGGGRWWGRLGAPSGAPCGAPSGAPSGAVRRTRLERIRGRAIGTLLKTAASARSTLARHGRQPERGRRTRHRTHATLPDWKTSAYGREMRRPWTTRCLRPNLRARLTLSDARQDDARPVGPWVAGGRRCRLQPRYAPPRGPHRAPTHPSPTDRRRAAVRATPRERDGRPGSRCLPARGGPGA
jgi:hypothetical protein